MASPVSTNTVRPRAPLQRPSKDVSRAPTRASTVDFRTARRVSNPAPSPPAPASVVLEHRRHVYRLTWAGLATTALAAAGTAGAVAAGAVRLGEISATVTGVLAPAALLLLAVELPRRYGRMRHACCLAATLSLGVGLGAMAVASPVGTVATLICTAVFLGISYVTAHACSAARGKQWSGGPSLALRLALNAGGAIATTLVPGGVILPTVAAAAGLGGAAASVFFNMVSLHKAAGSVSQNDALGAAVELYVHTISTFAFSWRVLLGMRLVGVTRL